MSILGLDIGGATLKFADTSGRAHAERFALWQTPNLLAEKLAAGASSFAADRLAVTMTGELCDCFDTKAEGVRSILSAVQAAFAAVADIQVWLTTGRFAPLAEAVESPWQAGASNWHALATFSGRFAPSGNALLIDIGSTTTDVIPLWDGVPISVGNTDPQRLAAGELIYQGVERTPLCAILDSVELNSLKYRTMAELFATTGDVYLVLGDAAEEPTNCSTADGRPATIQAARARLARMIGSDHTAFSEDDARQMANQVTERQRATIATAIQQVANRSLASRVDHLILSGQGEFLARVVAKGAPGCHSASILSLTEHLGPEISRAACAYSVAMLLEATPSSANAIDAKQERSRALSADFSDSAEK